MRLKRERPNSAQPPKYLSNLTSPQQPLPPVLNLPNRAMSVSVKSPAQQSQDHPRQYSSLSQAYSSSGGGKQRPPINPELHKLQMSGEWPGDGKGGLGIVLGVTFTQSCVQIFF